MNKSRLVKISKYLSYHLRHHPDKLGLQLAPGGWIAVDTLLTACQRDKFSLTAPELAAVVAENDKKRFSFDSTGKLIRANQGHSIEVDLQLEPMEPPAILYHGTQEDAVQSILKQGLSKMSRHHVHLSTDLETAKNVGKRHGKPVIFVVAAGKMDRDGYTFYCSENQVWLVEKVPPAYLTLDKGLATIRKDLSDYY
ncbi:MAG: RNA 2'-phosphotransferase [Oscillatoria sp. PMC 1068.18]|nr:RNA 2'-phosphotransferase [Oscillatoria sp. PMC 1076.18]MEC4988992.1 RNA 2'-phosphotransferase [Oscillatoria sp. PMC 1068.18]